MMKVKVSEEVSEVLNNAQGPSLNLSIYRFYKRITENYRGTSFDDWFDKNNITATDVENAFKHGWEVEYEFQVGDVVEHKESTHLFPVRKDFNFEYGVLVDLVNRKKNEYTLVCKAEDRKDLK